VILSVAMSIDDSLPTELASAHALIMAQREALVAAQARATAAESEAQYRALLIEKLKYTIRKLRHERFGQSSERGALLEQLELQLTDLEEDASQAEAARMAAAAATGEKITVQSFERRAGRRAVRCPSICRASVSSIRCPRPARAAAAGHCARSVRT
jgi:transposase